MTNLRTNHIPSEPTTNLVNTEDDEVQHGYHALGYILLGVAAGYVIGGLSVVLVLVASAVI